jgi:hypothetical protein
MFSGLYVLIFMCDHDAVIFLDAGPLDTVATTLLSKVDLQIAFWYFSSTLMSTTGYGDILPMSNAAKTVAMAQLLTNCVYSLGLFSVGIEHFRQAHDAKVHSDARNLARVGDGDESYVADGESGGSGTDGMNRDGRDRIGADSDSKAVLSSTSSSGATRRPRCSIDIVSVHVESNASSASESDSSSSAAAAEPSSTINESIETSDRKSRISIDNLAADADHDGGGSVLNDDNVDAGDGMCCFCCSCARFHALMRRLPPAPAWMIDVRDVLISNIFVVVLTLQLVQLLLVWMIDPKLLIAPTRGIQGTE